MFAEPPRQLARAIRVAGGVRVDVVRYANTAGFFGDRSGADAAPARFFAVSLTSSARLTVSAQVARGFRDPLLSERFNRGLVGRGSARSGTTCVTASRSTMKRKYVIV